METKRSVDYDAELQRHHELLTRAWGIRTDDRVLDVGCGAGQTTRSAARAAANGSALGVDISAPMIERARELAAREGVRNADFLLADAGTHPFEPGTFDVAISRFGTMFFADPAAAFGNLARALRSGGRLVMLVWQDAERNDWTVAIRQALATDRPSPQPSPNAFSLADPSETGRMLDAAGFSGATFADIDEPVYYGDDVAAALDWICGFSNVKQVLSRMEPADQARALDALRHACAARATDHGIWFGSRAWLVAAQRR